MVWVIRKLLSRRGVLYVTSNQQNSFYFGHADHFTNQADADALCSEFNDNDVKWYGGSLCPTKYEVVTLDQAMIEYIIGV